MKRINMPKGYSVIIHALMLLFSFFGAIMVTSASMEGATNMSLGMNIIKQLVFIVVSYIIMVFLARHFKWSWFRLGSRSLTFILIIVVISLIIPRFFEPIYGSYNWIPIGTFGTLQPSEFSKPVIIAIIASALGSLPVHEWMLDKNKLKRMRSKDQIMRVWEIIRFPVFMVLAMIGIVLVIQNDFGTTMIIVFIAVTMIFMASHPFITRTQKFLLLLFVVVMTLGIFAMTPNGIHYLESLGIQEYQLQRITSLYNLFDRTNVLGNSMQQVNGLLAFAKGGLFGNGLGSSILKYGYIPEAESDYILAILIDEFGFIGFFILTIGYIIIIYTLFKYAFKVSHQPSRLYLIGSATYIFIHYLFNVGGTSGLIPLTGVPLLLISAGGSSQLAIYAAIGISQNIIARQNSAKNKRK